MEQKSVIKQCNPIFQKEGQKGWPTGVDDSQVVLRLGYYYSATSNLLERSDFSSKLKQKVKGWSLSDLVCSALWFTFEKKQLSTYSWLRAAQQLYPGGISWFFIYSISRVIRGF